MSGSNEKQVYLAASVSYREQWKDLLNTFLILIDEYICYPNQNDIPYWYGERALTGLLSSAAWRLPGWWSLEEFLAERHRGNGRGDLWLSNGNAKFTVEAKVTWPEKLDFETETDKTTVKLDEARIQLKNLAEGYRYGKPFSICYIVPELSDRDFMEFKREKFFDRIATRFVNSGKFVAARYEFLKYSSVCEYEKRLYPGVVLIGREEVVW